MKNIENYKDGKLKCLLCGNFYSHLGSHIWHKHKILARDYKEEFELPYKMPLINRDIYIKKKFAFEKNADFYLENIREKGKKYQFKKGQTGQRRISQHERDVVLKRILNVNKNRKGKLEKCPVCKMKFNHLASHLANKHKLLIIK